MLYDHHRLQLIDTADEVVPVVVRCGDLCQSKRLPEVTDVEIDLPVVCPLGKDVGPSQQEAVVGAEGGVKLGVSGVGRVRDEEVDGLAGVAGFKGRVVYPQCVLVPGWVRPV